MPSVWAVPVLSPLSSCALVLPYTDSQGLRCSCLSYGGNNLRTSPEWFSLSFWLKLSCLKSIPASLLRVPFPVRKGEAQPVAMGPSSCCSLGPQRAAVSAWSRHCSCSEGISPSPPSHVKLKPLPLALSALPQRAVPPRISTPHWGKLCPYGAVCGSCPSRRCPCRGSWSGSGPASRHALERDKALGSTSRILQLLSTGAAAGARGRS